MATRSQAFPTNYLGKDDVPNPITVTIDRVTGEEIAGDGGKEEKRVAHFRESNIKPWIINSGNWQTIESISGQSDDENWGGTRIEIYVDPSVSFGGKRVGGLRVREPQQTRTSGGVDANAMRQQAMADAWKKFKQTAPPTETSEQTAARWKTAFTAYFPGKTKDQVSTQEWIRFAQNNFEAVSAPFEDEPLVPDDIEIPF